MLESEHVNKMLFGCNDAKSGPSRFTMVPPVEANELVASWDFKCVSVATETGKLPVVQHLAISVVEFQLRDLVVPLS